jgi:hypothetical protein
MSENKSSFETEQELVESWAEAIQQLPQIISITNDPAETIKKLEVTFEHMTDQTSLKQAVKLKKEFQDDLMWAEWLQDYGSRIIKCTIVILPRPWKWCLI